MSLQIRGGREEWLERVEERRALSVTEAVEISALLASAGEKPRTDLLPAHTDRVEAKSPSDPSVEWVLEGFSEVHYS